METSDAQIARQIIAENRYLSLATGFGGKVWIAPLAYVVDEEYNFYFTSATDSIHCQHIKNNPNVAFSIFNSTLPSDTVDGLQIAAVAGQVESKDLKAVVDLYFNQVFEDPEDRARWSQPIEHYTSNSFPFQRFFQIVPMEVYKIDTSTIEVDRRLEIKLSEIKSEPAKFPTLAQLRTKTINK